MVIQWHKTLSDQYRELDTKVLLFCRQNYYVMAEPAQDCLHIQAAYWNTLLYWRNQGKHVQEEHLSKDGMDTITLFNIMAGGVGLFTLKDKAMGHIQSLTLLHTCKHLPLRLLLCSTIK